MNSLNLTKASMFGADATFKINRADSVLSLISIDIEKKK